MATQRTPGASQASEIVIATFPTPTKGMMQNTETEVGIPADALWIGRNLHLFRGECRQRSSWNGRIGPSISVLNDPPRGSGIIGGFTIPETLNAIYTARRANTSDRYLFTGGNNRVQILQEASSNLAAGSGWKMVTEWNGTSWLEDVGAFVRFAEIAIGTPLLTNVIMCNGLRTPRLFKLGSTADLATPTLTSATLGPAGGVWPSTGIRYYVITALNGVGETVKSNEVSFNVTDVTKKVTLTWVTVPGAVAYNIYRSSVSGTYTTPALARTVIGKSALTDDDPGLNVTAGSPPAVSTALGFSPATKLDGADPWLDVCIASDRVVGITKTEVSWGETLRVDSWPLLNHKSLAETSDFCRAIRPLMGLHVMVWKEKSLWIGQARGGSSASYFTWKLQTWVDGPVSPRALVQTGNGTWYWMTRRGRIVRMQSGFQIDYPCDGVWPFVRASLAMDETSFSLAHAVWDPLLDEVRFFYTPSISDLDPVIGSGGTGYPGDIYGIKTEGTGIIDGGAGQGGPGGIVQITVTCCGGFNDGSEIWIADGSANAIKRIWTNFTSNGLGGNIPNPSGLTATALSLLLNTAISDLHPPGGLWRAVKH